MPPPTNVRQLQRRLTNTKTVVRTGLTLNPVYAGFALATAMNALRFERKDEILDIDLLHKPTAPSIAAAIRKAEQQQRFR